MADDSDYAVRMRVAVVKDMEVLELSIDAGMSLWQFADLAARALVTHYVGLKANGQIPADLSFDRVHKLFDECVERYVNEGHAAVADKSNLH
jgi:hypothetical protein